MAGYSGTPLPKKLGIKPGARLGVASAPDTFEDALGELPEGVALVDALRTKQPCDVIVGFVRRQAELRRLLPRLMRVLDPNGGLWIGWPKKASGVATDVTEDVVRDEALPLGLVDNKVCAIDDVWSGLRLVYRLENRPPTRAKTSSKR